MAALPPRSVAKEARTVDIAKVRKARFRKEDNTKTTLKRTAECPYSSSRRFHTRVALNTVNSLVPFGPWV